MVTSYSIGGFASLAADRVRTDGYLQALRQAVRPGCVVLDVGAGTGILAMLAARLGARRVFAVEPADAIEVARQTAAANGCAGRIEFFQALSTQVTLPEKADVIVSDLHGVLPLLGHHIPSIADARKRLLAPGGVLVPRCETLWVAVVEAPEVHGHHVNPWNGNTYGFDMGPSRRILTNTWRKARFAPEQLLVEPHRWATLDYAAVESPNVEGAVTWQGVRPGTAHGLALWFDATLADGVGWSNAPGAPEVIYGNGFFPWPAPVALDPGDSVSVTLRADLVGDDYVWRWDSRVLGGGRPEQVKASFKQSTFFGAPLSAGRLHGRSASHVPTLSEEGRLAQFVLALVDGTTPLGDIARRVAERFPERFPRWQDALTKVADLAAQYGR